MVEYPYNPNVENNSNIGVEDLMALLASFGMDFEVEELAAQNTSQHPGAHGKDVVGGRAPDAAHAGGEGSHASPPLSLASKTAR